MHNRTIAPLWVAVLCVLPLGASALPDPDAPMVELRTDCGTIQNCFGTMSELTTWVWGTRNPDQNNPLLVEVGPGEFGTFTCTGTVSVPRGDVTLRGSGREQSIVSGESGVDVTNCDRLHFHSIGIHGTQVGVGWIGAGAGEWSSVDLVSIGGNGGVAFAWADVCGSGNSTPSTHTFVDSRIRTTGVGNYFTSGIWSLCADIEFSGGEIYTKVPAGAAESSVTSVHLATDANGPSGNLAVSESLIRTIVWDDVSGSSLTGVDASGDGVFACIDCNINTTSNVTGSNINVTGLKLADQASAVTSGTSFVLNPSGTGVPTRVALSGSATVDSLVLWGPGVRPPLADPTTEANKLISVTGQDEFIETDCNNSGDCTSSSGQQTHLMVYDDTQCPASNPWYNTVIGACRS